ncbi:MAG TPA: AAA family ATPase [Methanoregulaceae archaeon]|nr:AAA family ATPase [Methanoregulaceae archaeon]HPW09657.1 AAA family ATPase [Methanoregulaceae archaeon]
MIISKINLHNYRGIHDINFELQNYSLFVGPNNSGKSTLVNAIRAFYEKDGFKYRKDTDTPLIHPKDKESWIEIHFKLTNEENESLAEEYKQNNNQLFVRKYFDTETKTHDGKSANGIIFGYNSEGMLSDEPFYGAKNVQSGKFGDIIYIPAVSKVDEHTKLTGPSALRDLVQNILSSTITESGNYDEFKEQVSIFSEGLRQEKTKEGYSIQSFEGELNESLNPWGVKFKIKLKTPAPHEIVKAMLDYDFEDMMHGKTQLIDNYGSGFQRHFIYSLINISSHYTFIKEKKKSKDFSPSMTLILFEEPEAFLHPSQQDILARNLMKFSDPDINQVVCSTHSPHFVSRNSNNIPGLIHFSNENGIIKTYQIGDDEWKSIVDSNQIVNKIADKYPKMKKRLQEDDLKPEMESVKNFLWLNPDRCGIFFANHAVLVEGPSEVALINKLIGDNKIKKSNCGLYVMDCIGKYNIHRFMNLISSLGIKHSVIFDDDDNQEEHLEFNQLIEESRNPLFTYAIKKIPKNLESFLSIPNAGSDHRKPQHILYLYECGSIAKDKIDSFCGMIDSCLPN